MHIDKLYFTLPEVLERWDMPEDTLIYLAVNDKLRLSIQVFGVPMEFGDYAEDADGKPFLLRTNQTCFNGLLDLHARDVYQLFRCGEIPLESFRTPRADYATTWGDAPAVLTLIGDLLLRREERDRFEAENGFKADGTPIDDDGFAFLPDNQEVRCKGHRFKLGPIQTEVVRVLHVAALEGEPWQAGKTILALARSKSMRMADVFKSQKNWRDLILSDGRGKYRLNLD